MKSYISTRADLSRELHSRFSLYESEAEIVALELIARSDRPEWGLDWNEWLSALTIEDVAAMLTKWEDRTY